MINYSIVRCRDVLKTRKFLEAISFSSLVGQELSLNFEHCLTFSALNNSYCLLVPDNLLVDVMYRLPVPQKQIILNVSSIQASKIAATLNAGVIIDEYTAIDLGKLCLIHYENEVFEIILIETSITNNTRDYDKSFIGIQLLTEWSMTRVISQSSRKLFKQHHGISSGGEKVTYQQQFSTLSNRNSMNNIGSADKSTEISNNNTAIKNQNLPINSKLGDSIEVVKGNNYNNKNSIGCNNERDDITNITNITNKTNIKNPEIPIIENETKVIDNMTIMDSILTDPRDGEEWNPPEGMDIQTIYMTILHKSLYRPMKVNTILPIPFKNEIFEGYVLLILDTKPPCEQYKSRFAGSSYRMEMQVAFTYYN